MQTEVSLEKKLITQQTIEVIINARSGTSDKYEIRSTLIEFFEKSGVTANIRMAENGSDIISLAESAARSQSTTIVAGGGDGTIAAVVNALIGADKNLGILPLGTFNYFARNLGIPLDIAGAVQNLINGKVKKIPVGEVNGRIFLNNASLGLYPAALRRREGVYRRWGRSRLAAYFSVVLVLLRPAAFMRLRLEAGGERKRHKTPLVFVGNNEYQLKEFNIPAGTCLKENSLVFYILNPASRLGLIRLAVRMLFGRLNDKDDFQLLCLKEAWIKTKRKRARVAMDGEVFRMKAPLCLRVLPEALGVIVPAESIESTSD